MIEITELSCHDMEAAIRGMRNPFKGTSKSDSEFGIASRDRFYEEVLPNYIWNNFIKDNKEDHDSELKRDFYGIASILNIYEDAIQFALIGQKDLELARKLVLAGSPHDKFLRQIPVSMDINAPLFFWKELDTYKIGTVADSESTMHTITQRNFIKEDFSYDDSFYCDKELLVNPTGATGGGFTSLEYDIFLLNTLRGYWIKEEDLERKTKIWRTIIQKLPSSYMQKRTWTANYSILASILKQRANHRLSEWKTFCTYMNSLPYANTLLKGEKENVN